jgi:Ankyrin repeats (3 copies)
VAALPGLDPSARTRHERTALHFAAGKGQAYMVDFLLELPGVDVEAVCNQGRTPLAWTAVDFMELAPEVATTLLKNHNALPNTIRSDGDTVLHTCVKWQNHGIAKLLLVSVLIWLIPRAEVLWCWRPYVCVSLANKVNGGVQEHGADVTIRNPLGKTALECAQSDRDPHMRDPHMVDLIEKHIVEAALAAKAARHERRKARAARNERRKAKAARKEKAKEEVVEDAFLDPYGLD